MAPRGGQTLSQLTYGHMPSEWQMILPTSSRAYPSVMEELLSNPSPAPEPLQILDSGNLLPALCMSWTPLSRLQVQYLENGKTELESAYILAALLHMLDPWPWF